LLGKDTHHGGLISTTGKKLFIVILVYLWTSGGSELFVFRTEQFLLAPYVRTYSNEAPSTDMCHHFGKYLTDILCCMRLKAYISLYQENTTIGGSSMNGVDRLREAGGLIIKH
jgi:hypothetical protein